MNSSQTAAPDLRERTLDYAVRAIHLFDYLQAAKNRAAWKIADQYLRAATAIGANLEEAHGSESRADFSHKCAISLKEARESLYWLRLLQRAKILSQSQLGPIVQETNELVAIFTTIVRKTRKPLLKRIPLAFFALLSVLF